jgi:hypothetical protein
VTADDGSGGKKKKRPLYPRLLRLRHVQPNAWQRAALGEGALALAAVLVLADVASAWTLLVLPLGVAGVVKAHDVLAGLLSRTSDQFALDRADSEPEPDTTTAPTPEGTGAVGRRER